MPFWCKTVCLSVRAVYTKEFATVLLTAATQISCYCLLKFYPAMKKNLNSGPPTLTRMDLTGPPTAALTDPPTALNGPPTPLADHLTAWGRPSAPGFPTIMAIKLSQAGE